MILGGDYSLYDDILDWENHNWRYAFIKASEGTVADPVFQDQWKAARGHVYRGAYHFFRPIVSWIEAAQKFCFLLSGERGELPPVLDLESTDGQPNALDSALRWLEEVHHLLGRRPIVYTSPGFVSMNNLHRYLEFGDYPLWMAQYPFDKIQGTWTEEKRRQRILDIINGAYAYVYPEAPAPWKGKPLWVQWTGKCPPEYVPGYPLGNKLAVDVNFYQYDLQEMVYRFDLPILEGDEDMSSKPITWTALLRGGLTANLRSGPGLTYAIRKSIVAPTGGLPFQGTGQKVQADGYYWGEVVLPEPGFIAFTTSFTDVKWITEPVPPATVQRKAVKTIIYYDDSSQEEMYPG